MSEQADIGLRPFGYAPGSYMGSCIGCGRVFANADKRAIRCERCALRLAIRDLQSALATAEAAALERAASLDVLRRLAELGGGWDMQAYHDLPEDTIVYENSGAAITAGDVRRAREIVGRVDGRAVSEMHFRREGHSPAPAETATSEKADIVAQGWLSEELQVSADFMRALDEIKANPRVIEELRSALASAEADLGAFRDERARAAAAMKEAIGEELWGLGHPAYVVVHLREELTKVTRLWKEASCRCASAEAAALERAAKVAQTYFVGMFTGWRGYTNVSRITLDEAEDVANECGPLCAAAIRRLIPASHSPAPAGEAERLRAALRDLVDWLEDNERTLDGEFVMDEVLADARAALASAQAQTEGQK